MPDCCMLYRHTLEAWVLEAIAAKGGEATVVEVCRHVWDTHEAELRSAGDLFYTWQYDIRWAAQNLRNTGQLAPTARGRAAKWSFPPSG